LAFSPRPCSLFLRGMGTRRLVAWHCGFWCLLPVLFCWLCFAALGLPYLGLRLIASCILLPAVLWVVLRPVSGILLCLILVVWAGSDFVGLGCVLFVGRASFQLFSGRAVLSWAWSFVGLACFSGGPPILGFVFVFGLLWLTTLSVDWGLGFEPFLGSLPQLWFCLVYIFPL